MKNWMTVWVPAALIIGLAALGMALVPGTLPRNPAYYGRRILPGSGAAAGGSAPLPTGGVRVVRPEFRIIEPASPIVDPEGVLVESLGIEAAGGAMTTVLPRGSRTPARRMIQYGAPEGSPAAIRIHVLRGISERAADNTSLGRWGVDDLPEAAPGSPRAVIILRVADGAVLMAALTPRGDPLPIRAIGTGPQPAVSPAP